MRRPIPYDDDYTVIDPAQDQPIYPAGINQGLNVLMHGGYRIKDFDDGYADFAELDYFEHRERWPE